MTSDSMKGEKWPWISPLSSVERLKKEKWPKISIVTPSYNQGQFIEETILSVIRQNYPNLEYIIIDGGSIDNTIEIIKKYEQQITYWVSEPDRGQSHAINKGFNIATGDILAWINSDDYYAVSTFSSVASSLDTEKAMLLYGNASYYYQNTDSFKEVDVIRQNEKKVLPFDLGFIQPATFWTAKLWKVVGKLDESLHFAFDLDWYLRGKQYTEYLALLKEVAVYRIHDAHKTSLGGDKRGSEIMRVIEKNGFTEYTEVLDKLKTSFVISVTAFTSQLMVGTLFFFFYRIFNPRLWHLSIGEISQLFDKKREIHSG